MRTTIAFLLLCSSCHAALLAEMNLTIPGTRIPLFGLQQVHGPQWVVESVGTFEAPEDFVQFTASNWTDDHQKLNFLLGGHTDLIDVSHFFHPVYNVGSQVDYAWNTLDVWTTLTPYVDSFSHQVITGMIMTNTQTSTTISIYGHAPEPSTGVMAIILICVFVLMTSHNYYALRRKQDERKD